MAKSHTSTARRQKKFWKSVTQYLVSDSYMYGPLLTISSVNRQHRPLKMMHGSSATPSPRRAVSRMESERQGFTVSSIRIGRPSKCSLVKYTNDDALKPTENGSMCNYETSSESSRRMCQGNKDALFQNHFSADHNVAKTDAEINVAPNHSN